MTRDPSSDLSTRGGVRALVVALFGLNVAHIFLLTAYGRLARRHTASNAYTRLAADETELVAAKNAETADDLEVVHDELDHSLTDDGRLAARGRINLALCAALIVLAWLACILGRL